MIRVFVADRLTLVAEALGSLLEGAGFVVAGRGEDSAATLEGLRATRATVLLLDPDLPGRGALEVLAEIRRLALETRVLIVSGQSVDAQAVRLIQAGAAGFLARSASAEELASAVRRIATGGWALPDELTARLVVSSPAARRRFSPREERVLALLGQGFTIGQIAAELALSAKTVSTYRSRLIAKLDLRTTNDLVAHAVRNSGSSGS